VRVPLSWLREYVGFEVDAQRLANDLTLCGLAVDAVLTSGDDVVLDLDITTNRVDCMNVHGVAREVATLYGKPLLPIERKVAEKGAPASAAVRIEVEAPDLCPRFCARVLDVRVAASPDWLKQRLAAAGVRSISNVVDATNYVMLEMGQPTHAFDAALIPRSALVVRWARAGETLRTLDGTDRTLGPKQGVVAGPELALALAGVMGGAASEVSDATTTIVLEAAYWTPLAVRRSAKSLGMHTEASHRFERGADPEAPLLALDRVANLLEKLGAGSARPGVLDVSTAPRTPRILTLRYAQVERVLGLAVAEERCDAILLQLGFAAGQRDGASRTFTVPSWRSDVQREVDLIEEVARHVGLDALPTTMPRSSARLATGLKREQRRERAVREVLSGAGYTENINYAFVSSRGAAAYGATAVALENPLSEDRDVLRTSLVFPGLLANLEANLRQGRRDVALFEIGHVFAPRAGGGTGDANDADAAGRPAEHLRLGLLASGSLRRPGWSEKPRPADFFDAKGIVALLGATLGAPSLQAAAGAPPPFLHPGKAALVSWQAGVLGYAGVLHPDLGAALGLRGDVVIGELDLEGLLAMPAAMHETRPLPRFPGVARDLSLVIDAARPAAEWLVDVRRSAGPLLADAEVADRYSGSPLPAGKVSLTLRLRYQHEDRTLTGDEVQASLAAVAAALGAAGAEIRGEG
jgi:phenylalanyl-tRNA synthetase beta chain